MSNGVIYTYSNRDDSSPHLWTYQICYSNIYTLPQHSSLTIYIPQYTKQSSDCGCNYLLTFNEEEIALYIMLLNKMGLHCELLNETEQVEEHVCYLVDVDCGRTSSTGVKVLLNAIRYLFEWVGAINDTSDTVREFLALWEMNLNEPVHTLFLLAHNLSEIKCTGHNLIPMYEMIGKYSIQEWDDFLKTPCNHIQSALKHIPLLTGTKEEKIQKYLNL